MKDNLKKIDIAKNLSKNTGLSINFSKKLIDDLISILLNLIKIDGLILKNLGTFKIINKKERIGRNPKTNQEYLVSKRKSISFKSAKKLDKLLNNNL